MPSRGVCMCVRVRVCVCTEEDSGGSECELKLLEAPPPNHPHIYTQPSTPLFLPQKQHNKRDRWKRHGEIGVSTAPLVSVCVCGVCLCMCVCVYVYVCVLRVCVCICVIELKQGQAGGQTVVSSSESVT